ncbi:UNVERIFIED_CONTAM: Retrovirus-related Pol polyprotein from transposon opus [Sesamum indicum]
MKRVDESRQIKDAKGIGDDFKSEAQVDVVLSKLGRNSGEEKIGDFEAIARSKFEQAEDPWKADNDLRHASRGPIGAKEGQSSIADCRSFNGFFSFCSLHFETQNITKIADGTRLKELQEAQKKTDIMFLDERAKREASVDELHGRMDQMLEVQEGLQNSVLNVEHSLTATVEKGSNLRATPYNTIRQDGGSSTRHETSGNQSSGTYNVLNRLEFPHFDVENARGWLIPIPEDQRLSMLPFTCKARQNFGTKALNNAKVTTEFNKLHHETNVDAYLEGFEELKDQMLIFNRSLDEDFLMMKFISGLKDEVKLFVTNCEPTSLNQAINLARNQEQTVNAILKRVHHPTRNLAPKPPNKKPPQGPSTQPTRFLTEAEVRAKREKNLCYRCDEPYVPGHKCRYRQVYMLLKDEGTRDSEEDKQGRQTTEAELEKEEDVSVSLHAMKGNFHYRTLRLEGTVEDKEILILINSGSTHCFLDEKVANLLGCKLEKTHPMMLGLYNPIELDFHQGRITLSQGSNKVILKALHWRSPEVQGKLLLSHNTSIEATESIKVQEVLQGYEDIFREPHSLPPEREIEHRIEMLPEAIPRKQHPYSYAYGYKTEIEKIVKKMLDSGIIRPSQSSFASPVLLVKKKDRGWRMCFDYRYLNKLTMKHNFPIPVIDELLDELHGAKYFSKIDLRSGYFQIRMRKEDIPKISFITHNGHYEFLVMPFGLCNAPSIFQSLMNTVFEPYLRKFVLIFFDDILIYTKDWGMHLIHLRNVMDLLRKHHLFAKGALMGLLGLTGYYRRFIQGYGVISKPLTSLLKKDVFEWNVDAEKTFNHLNELMVSAPMLAMPDFSQPFIVETDGSGKGIGVVLMQGGKFISYISKALAPKNLGLSTYEKELLALLLAVTKWRHYLLGSHFIIRTDQKSLKHILDQRVDSML